MIADVTCAKRIRQVFEKRRPEVVFHAAAHKHVPLMEANPGEAIRNNVLGTRIVADLADEYDVLSFVLVSTDKAVHPTSIMGVSKHLAERYVHALSQESSTRLVVTRFGNVLGSNGSVVPIFQEQIRRGGPITITDERMTRFFMSIPEASQLVLQAAAMGQGAKSSFWTWASRSASSTWARPGAALRPPEDSIEIVFTGVRPGKALRRAVLPRRRRPHAAPQTRAAFHRPTGWRGPGRGRRSGIPADAPEEIIRRRLKQLVPEFQGKAETGTRKAESGTLAGQRVESVVVRG